jgi:aminopeptidase N
MKDSQSKAILLRDYKAPNFLIDETVLKFDLFETYAIVDSTLQFSRNVKGIDELVLDGQELELLNLEIEEVPLAEESYAVTDSTLTIRNLSKILGRSPDNFSLRCVTRIEPQNNTALEGLYKSKKMFCTQCEAEGFRRITYYLDRPDVMSKFTTTIIADKAAYPTLLSNGNLLEDNKACGNDSKSLRHSATWEDPFKKPSYLFALVAGKLSCKEDVFSTISGREITLKIFVEGKDLDKIDHAMDSLKRAMKWDEKVYGREYDLDIFMIVAVDDFNMGAMENKGLNIFNTSCVLANPLTTTDMAFQRVEAVVAHEYFHNWSGNRVTCRDWFQLSLKEGFTVYRDAEFSAEMGSPVVKRIEDVSLLQTVQFAEDSGPMAHSVRPDSYIEISNFYTVTIYEKGAEVVRMINLLLGDASFRKGSDLYFERHDGQAVTTEDFVCAMEDASGKNLSLFRRWYSQAGTPRLEVKGYYDEIERTYTLDVGQSCLPTPGQDSKLPFHIPLKIGLLDKLGNDMPLLQSGNEELLITNCILDVTDENQRFVFVDVAEPPIPSLLREFSAPVTLSFQYTREELSFLAAHDNDGFNKWNAGQLLFLDVIDELLVLNENDEELYIPPCLYKNFSCVLESALNNQESDKAFLAYLLTIPSGLFLIERSDVANVGAIYKVRHFVIESLAKKFKSDLEKLYFDTGKSLSDQLSVSGEDIGKRMLKNLCLSYLVHTDRGLGLCESQFNSSRNMTDQTAALRGVLNSGDEKAEELRNSIVQQFYERWKDESLVVNNWFSLQATSSLAGGLSRVESLLSHEAFNLKNPNKVRALIGAFCGQNANNFHLPGGEGYKFLADQVLKLDAINPQIAARLLAPLTRFNKFEPAARELMLQQLHRIKASDSLSKDVSEIVEKSTI